MKLMKLLALLFSLIGIADGDDTLSRSEVRILFLGDSITAAAHYVDDIETSVILHLEGRDVPEMTALGLSSETASGLSEAAHPFPRPNVHERLERVLLATEPDIVVACYGMNDAIYQPFSDERFAAYQEGIRLLIKKSQDAGARVVLLTPPPYVGKAQPSDEPRDESEYDYRSPFPAYDSVLARYAKWILTLDAEERVDTIDIRTPMLAQLAESYGDDPIHPNPHGHRVMSRAFLAQWVKVATGIDAGGIPDQTQDSRWPDLRKLVAERRKVYDGKLLWEIGHKRPGDAPEITLAAAQERAAEIDREIVELFSR